MTIVKLFDFVDKDLNPVLFIEGLKNFYEKVENPILEYYTYESERANLIDEDLKYFLVGDFYEAEELGGEELFLKNYFSALEKSVFGNLNKKFRLEVLNYKNLIKMKKDSNYREDYVSFEKYLDRFQENIFESDVRIFYSDESSSFIKNLKGQTLRDVEGFNKYLKIFYEDY